MKKLFMLLFVLLVIIPLLLLTVDFIRFPECYLSTWKYQLERDIESGEETAVAYYKNTYLANGRILFD